PRRPQHQGGDADLQREGRTDDPQADALLAGGEKEGDREDRDDAEEVDRDGRHARLSWVELARVSPFAGPRSNPGAKSSPSLLGVGNRPRGAGMVEGDTPPSPACGRRHLPETSSGRTARRSLPKTAQAE